MTMMSADIVDPFETGGKMGDDNPLAMFDSAATDTASGGGGTASSDVTASDNNGTADLLGTGNSGGIFGANNVPSAGVFDDANGELKEYALNDDNSDTVEIIDEDDDSNDDGAADPDLLNMGGGWNLQRHTTDAEAEDGVSNAHTPTVGEEYGVDENAGKKSTSRRGLFGGWGSSRKNSSQGDTTDLLSGDTAGAPSWSNASGGGGFFGRRGQQQPNNNIDPSKSLDNSNSSSDSYSKVPRDGIDEAGQAYGEGGITGDDDIITETTDPELEEEQRMDNMLRPGDHIYVWQTYGINPRAYQRHAVVFSVTKGGAADPTTQRPFADVQPVNPSGEEPLAFDTDTLYTDNEDDVEVTVVSFYHLNRLHQAHGAAQAAQAASGRRGKRSGSKREFLYDFIGPDGINRKKPIHKVRYGRKVKKGILSQKAGVGTALKKDQVGLILARVQYVLDHPDHMPDHNALSANGECASLWCVTGRWCTLQGASILAIMSGGTAGGALLAGGILSNLTVLIPMPGVWGMAGWWWYVPATVAYPFLVPMLVTLGMCSLVPLEILRRNRKKWRGITDGLNHEFWTGTSEAIKEEYFGAMATAEKEAEMRSFFGVREGDTAADDSKYMPLGGAPGGMDDDSDDEDAEAMAMQQMENSCKNMATDMNVDLSGKPPSKEGSSPKGGVWGKVTGSFRRSAGGSSGQDDSIHETQRFHTSYTE